MLICLKAGAVEPKQCDSSQACPPGSGEPEVCEPPWHDKNGDECALSLTLIIVIVVVIGNLLYSFCLNFFNVPSSDAYHTLYMYLINRFKSVFMFVIQFHGVTIF